MSMKTGLSIICAAIVVFVAVSSGASANGEIILTAGDFPPYVFEGTDDPGPIAAIITAAFKEQGIAIKIDFYPWKRAENEVREGRAFAVFPYRRTAEREKEFDFSDPFYTYTAKFFYNKKYHPDGVPYEKLEDLLPYMIGGEMGFWYEPLFNKTGLNVEYVVGIEQNIKKLQSGRIDLLPEEENSAWYLIRKLFPDEVSQFGTLAKPFEEPGVINKLGLMVSRSYPNSVDVLKKFNAGLATIRSNGIYKQILEKYQLSTEGQ